MHACYKNINVKDTTQILQSPLSRKFRNLSEKIKNFYKYFSKTNLEVLEKQTYLDVF